MTSHWLLDSLAENRNLALRQASRSQIRRELMGEPFKRRCRSYQTDWRSIGNGCT